MSKQETVPNRMQQKRFTLILSLCSFALCSGEIFVQLANPSGVSHGILVYLFVEMMLFAAALIYFIITHRKHSLQDMIILGVLLIATLVSFLLAFPYAFVGDGELVDHVMTYFYPGLYRQEARFYNPGSTPLDPDRASYYVSSSFQYRFFTETSLAFLASIYSLVDLLLWKRRQK